MCKATYYGLDEQKEDGCSKCQCDKRGSLNEFNICDRQTGQCHCKSRVTSLGCTNCKSGSYQLERNNIFGCKQCQCQVGSSYDNICDQITGKCSCLDKIIGDTCDRPEEGYYIPRIDQFKLEIEDGYTKNRKPVRYDFDEEVFKNYSWKGYVKLNRIVGEVSQKVKVIKRGTYRMVLNYVNKNSNKSQLLVRAKPDPESNMDEQNATVVSLILFST